MVNITKQRLETKQARRKIENPQKPILSGLNWTKWMDWTTPNQTDSSSFWNLNALIWWDNDMSWLNGVNVAGIRASKCLDDMNMDSFNEWCDRLNGAAVD